MPEGDTIWRAAAALRSQLVGKTVVEARPGSLDRLKGRRVESVEPNGKHLLMQFDRGIALHSHMRMTGAWHLYRPGERWREPKWRATAVLSFEDVVAVCFAAPTMELTADSRLPVAHLGRTSWPSRSSTRRSSNGHVARSGGPSARYCSISGYVRESATSISASRSG